MAHPRFTVMYGMPSPYPPALASAMPSSHRRSVVMASRRSIDTVDAPHRDTIVAQLSMPSSAAAGKGAVGLSLGPVLVAEEPGDDGAAGPGHGGGSR